MKPHAEYRRAVKKAVKEHGVAEQDLHDAVEFVHGERKIHHDERESAKEAARKLTGLTAGDVSRLANGGHDYASGRKAGGLTGAKLAHFDEFAQEVARNHPELGLGDPDDPRENFAANLWNVLAEGKRSMVTKHDPEVIDEAVRLIHASGGRNYSQEDGGDADVVPFSVDGGGREHAPPGNPGGGQFVGKGSTFVSPNRHQNLTLDQAIKEVKRPSTIESLRRSVEITEQIAGRAAASVGVGCWKDGAEPTFIFRFHEPIDSSKLNYVAAWQGLILRQKAVLPFQYDGNGPDVLWTAKLSGDIKEADALLKKTGLGDVDRTIRELSKGIAIVQFFDEGGQRLSLLNDWSHKHGIKLEGTRGSGHLIPAETADRGKSVNAFREIISSYEKESPNEDHVRAPWARDCLHGRNPWARRGESGQRGLGDQFSIADPPARDSATSEAAKQKEKLSEAATPLALAIRARLDALLKKN